MYKISVAFFVLLFSMTTFVAAAPDGTRQPVYIAPFRKRAYGNQEPFRKRDLQGANKSLQMKVLRGAVTTYCTGHREECMKAIGRSGNLEQFEQGSVGGGAPPDRAERIKVLQKAITTYCAGHHEECMTAIGRSGNFEQIATSTGST